MSSLVNKLNHTVQCKENIKQAINDNLGGGTELVSSSTPFDEYGQIINPIPDNISQYLPFSTASWTEIKEVADLGYGKYVYNKGDTKQVGNYTVTICAFDYDLQIMDYTQNVSKKTNITFSLGYIPFTNVTAHNNVRYPRFAQSHLSTIEDNIKSIIKVTPLDPVRIYSSEDVSEVFLDSATFNAYGSPALYVANQYDLKYWNINFNIPSDCTFAWNGNSTYSMLNILPGYNPLTLESTNISGNTQSKLYANICFCL